MLNINQILKMNLYKLWEFLGLSSRSEADVSHCLAS